MTKITMAAARKNAGLTQQELADKMGVSRETVRHWESGKRKIKTAYLFMFCSIVGMETDDIFLPQKFTKRELSCYPTGTMNNLLTQEIVKNH